MQMADEIYKQCHERCNHVGHLWDEAGGGLELCLVCEAERWAEGPDEFTGAGCCEEEDGYLRARAASTGR